MEHRRIDRPGRQAVPSAATGQGGAGHP